MLQSSWIALGAMLLSMAAYQISASLAKQLIQILDPLSVVTLRLCFASVLVIIMLRSWHVLKHLRFAKWRDLMAYSASLGAMNLLFYYSLGKLPQGLAVALEFIGPLLLAFLSLKQRRDAIWVILAVVGLMLLPPWQTQSTDAFSIIGAACALAAGACWALYIYFGHKVVRQQIGMHALSIAIAISALCLLPAALWMDAPKLLQIQYWPHALLIAILATALPYALDLFALKHLSKVSYGTLSSLAPALAVVAGFVFLHEQISTIQSIALLCIIMASIAITRQQNLQRS